MKRNIYGIKVMSAIAALALVFMMGAAGCGGGGSDYEDACVKNPFMCQTGTTVTGRVVIPSSISLSRAGESAERSASLTSVKAFEDATVVMGHMVYTSSLGAYITYDINSSTTVDEDGYFSLSGVPTDDNMILTAYYTTTGGTTYTVNNIISVPDAYNNSVYSAATSSVETTFAAKALELILEEYNDNATSGTYDAEDLSTSDTAYLIDLIEDNLQAAYSAGEVTSVVTVLYSQSSILNELDNLVDYVPQLKTHVGQMTAPSGTAPFVVGFSPVDGATGVSYNGTTFKVMFSDNMDSSIDFNNQTTLTASGFSITIDEYYSSGSVTINYANALSYGSFGWTTTVLTNDTLTFTLKSSSTLISNGLYTLNAGTKYEITAFTVPTNLQSSGGTDLDTDGGEIPSLSGGNYGTFTTSSQ